jgi:hypothetical protein
MEEVTQPGPGPRRFEVRYGTAQQFGFAGAPGEPGTEYWLGKQPSDMGAAWTWQYDSDAK